MADAITRLFDSYSEATTAVDRLEAAGVPHHHISIIGHDMTGHERELGHNHDRGHEHGHDQDGIDENEAADGAGKGVRRGGLIGGAGGLLAGLGMLAIPGLGPVVAAGWLVSTAVGAAIGAAAGGAAGGILGALKDAGHTDEEANVYAEGVRRGSTLVSVKTDSDAQAATAREVLNGQGGVDALTRGAEYRTTGWQAFDASAQPYRAESSGYAMGEKRSFGGGSEPEVGGEPLSGDDTREGFANPLVRPAEPRRDF